MTTFRDAILPALDVLRGIPGQMGVRRTSVTARVVTWSGSRPGHGTATVVDTPLLVGAGTQNPHVRQISARDALASGGKYTNQDLRVGPVTPQFLPTEVIQGGGVALPSLDPPQGSSPCEVYFKCAGDGFQSPTWFERIGDEVVSPTKYFLILRRSGVQNPGGKP